MSSHPYVSYLVGDARAGLARLAASSVDLVLTSPPFLALRSYLPVGHPAKSAEVGTEASPGAYLDALLDVVEECERVLAPHGSIAFELGDTYAGSGGAGGDYRPGATRQGQPIFVGSARAARSEALSANRALQETARWPNAKSLCLIPELFRFALAYGTNPLTGRRVSRWRVRNVVRWCRTNPPVGALADKFRPATTEIVVATKSVRRYFDLDAVRQPDPDVPAEQEGEAAPPLRTTAPPKDFWLIPTEGYAGAHYATWPERLVVRPIVSMCPPRVCLDCGQPARRIGHTPDAIGEATGWSDCGCARGTARWRAGVVVDPFAGTGTTLAVALGHGRSAIGIDLDARNVALAQARLGMWLGPAGREVGPAGVQPGITYMSSEEVVRVERT